MKNLKVIILTSLLFSFTNAVMAMPINVNTASVEEISKLKGIGATKAAAIVAQCQTTTPCATPNDLLKVKGIGSKTLEKIKDSIVFK